MLRPLRWCSLYVSFHLSVCVFAPSKSTRKIRLFRKNSQMYIYRNNSVQSYLYIYIRSDLLRYEDLFRHATSYGLSWQKIFFFCLFSDEYKKKIVLFDKYKQIIRLCGQNIVMRSLCVNIRSLAKSLYKFLTF